MISLIYKNSCPNCNGDISSGRLLRSLPCDKCIREEDIDKNICEVINEGNLKNICNLYEDLKKFEELFIRTIKSSLWSLQRTWAVRYFLGNSFALLAPTGIGKTTFGLVLSKYIVENKGGKIYLLFPTELLAMQAYQKLIDFDVNNEDILLYKSNSKDKDIIKEKIKNCDFKILITTTMFLYKNIEIIPKGVYDLIFIDDVDSILKSAKNIDKVFLLLGFSDEDIKKVMKSILKRKNNEEDQKEEIKEIVKKKKGTLIVSSATSNPRSNRILLFRELLGFEVGKPYISIRNVEDIYEKVEENEIFDKSLEKIKEFGDGGLIFLSPIYGKEYLERYINFLKEKEINALSYEDLQKDSLNFERFKRGEIQVIVGFSSYKNPLARGIDLPETIKYALFIGVPKMKFKINYNESFNGLLNFLSLSVPFIIRNDLFDKDTQRTLVNYLNLLREYKFYKEENLPQNVKNKIKEIREFLRRFIEESNFLEIINKSKDIAILEENKELYAIIPDITGYIQASGRTSRVYAGGITKGLSYVLVDDDKAFNFLIRKIKWYNEDINFKPFNEIKIEDILKSINEDREKVKKFLKDPKEIPNKNLIKTTLIIVESPNKARTIANFFGKPIRRNINGINVYEIATADNYFIIMATKGHIYDLNKEEGYYGVLDDGKFTSIYEFIDQNREEIVKTFRNLNLEVDEVYIATDPDTEGEKIAYDIFLNSLPFNRNVKRTEFHEVTKRAFLSAIKNSREIDENLVKAQLLRRISDRWIGFEISQFIQKRFHNNTLSAGRVQTPVLEWIVNRAKIAKEKIYNVRLYIEDENSYDFEFENQKIALEFINNVDNIKIKKVDEREEKLVIKPLSTDALLRDASLYLKFSPQKTMELAQELFESGLITYHRTDSIRVSDDGVLVALSYIKDNFGESLIKIRNYSSFEGAHECIRPTKPLDVEELTANLLLLNIRNITKEHLRLYDLIFRNFIASQMKETVVKIERFEISAMDKKIEKDFITSIIEDGYNLIIPVKTYSIKEGIFKIINKRLFARSKVSYYTFAAIIEEMKEKGIGRPSTYAITIDKLLERGYVIESNGYLIPTKLGISVIEDIKRREELYKFVEENYTKELEEKMDLIEKNRLSFYDSVKDLFEKISTVVERA